MVPDDRPQVDVVDALEAVSYTHLAVDELAHNAGDIVYRSIVVLYMQILSLIHISSLVIAARMAIFPLSTGVKMVLPFWKQGRST